VADAEGILVKPGYSEPISKHRFLETWPGIAPYLRGPYPRVCQPALDIRQYAGFSPRKIPTPSTAATSPPTEGLSVAFDLATHRGYDSDHPRVTGDVGMAGVRDRFHLRHAHAVFGHSARPDERVDDHERRGAAILALFVRPPRNRGVPPEKLSGTIQNDILKEFMVRNTYIYPPAPSMRIISDIFAYTSQKMPKYNSISISGYHMQEAGATQDLELAYTLATASNSPRRACRRPRCRRFAPRLSFFWRSA